MKPRNILLIGASRVNMAWMLTLLKAGHNVLDRKTMSKEHLKSTRIASTRTVTIANDSIGVTVDDKQIVIERPGATVHIGWDDLGLAVYAQHEWLEAKREWDAKCFTCGETDRRILRQFGLGWYCLNCCKGTSSHE